MPPSQTKNKTKTFAHFRPIAAITSSGEGRKCGIMKCKAYHGTTQSKARLMDIRKDGAWLSSQLSHPKGMGGGTTTTTHQPNRHTLHWPKRTTSTAYLTIPTQLCSHLANKVANPFAPLVGTSTLTPMEFNARDPHLPLSLHLACQTTPNCTPIHLGKDATLNHGWIMCAQSVE